MTIEISEPQSQTLPAYVQAAGVKANYAELNSSHGHDGFLAEAAQLAPITKAHLEEEQPTFAGAGRRY